jgi:hypothetical protein
MIILQISDFENGKFEIHTGMYAQTNIQEYIDKYEKRYLIDLLGATLGSDFISDVQAGSGTPTIQKYVDIFNPIEIDYSLEIIQSDGIKEMLKGFIYYEYVKDLVTQMTAVGMVTPKGENSERVNTLFTQMYTRYNDACRSYKGVQKYIWTRRGDYDEFNGRAKQFITWL